MSFYWGAVPGRGSNFVRTLLAETFMFPSVSELGASSRRSPSSCLCLKVRPIRCTGCGRLAKQEKVRAGQGTRNRAMTLPQSLAPASPVPVFVIRTAWRSQYPHLVQDRAWTLAPFNTILIRPSRNGIPFQSMRGLCWMW